MKKTVLVVAAVAAIGLAVPTAHASKVANPNELRVHHRAAVVPIGKCGDLCRVAAGPLHDGATQIGVQVILWNYNDHPVKIRTNLYADGGGSPVSVTTRLPAHSQREFVQPWDSASSYLVSFDDLANAADWDLGAITIVKPT